MRTITLEIVETAIERLTDEVFRTFEISLTILDKFELINLCALRKDLLIGVGTVPSLKQAWPSTRVRQLFFMY